MVWNKQPPGPDTSGDRNFYETLFQSPYPPSPRGKNRLNLIINVSGHLQADSPNFPLNKGGQGVVSSPDTSGDRVFYNALVQSPQPPSPRGKNRLNLIINASGHLQADSPKFPLRKGGQGVVSSPDTSGDRVFYNALVQSPNPPSPRRKIG